MADDTTGTLAQEIARQMAEAGVERLFGVPGGGSSLQLIAAAEEAGIPFVLCKTETGGAIMAAVTGRTFRRTRCHARRRWPRRRQRGERHRIRPP